MRMWEVGIVGGDEGGLAGWRYTATVRDQRFLYNQKRTFFSMSNSRPQSTSRAITGAMLLTNELAVSRVNSPCHQHQSDRWTSSTALSAVASRGAVSFCGNFADVKGGRNWRSSTEPRGCQSWVGLLIGNNEYHCKPRNFSALPGLYDCSGWNCTLAN
jgi:hypothetical protein